MHRAQDTFPLSDFRQHTSAHLERLAKGNIEIITQNGEAAMVVMSPERYDTMTHEIERGRLWQQAITRIGKDDGHDARTAIANVARELDITL